MATDFDTLVRGSLIMSWSPSGELKRYIVTEANVPMVYTGEAVLTRGHRVAELTATNELMFAGEIFTTQHIEELEGFGNTFTYFQGVVMELPT